MRIFTIVDPNSISNIYFITDEKQEKGVLIDPGSFGENVYQMINRIGADIDKVIITHNNSSKTKGLKVIKKIYDAEIYAHNKVVEDFEAIKIKDGDKIEFDGCDIVFLETPVHSYDSISVYANDSLFVGEILQAGTLSSLDKNSNPSEFELSIIKKYFMELDENTIIYPSIGPATTLKIEKQYNPFFQKVFHN